MKKTLFLSFVTIAVFSFSSCKKVDFEDDDELTSTEETINASINCNESYQFTLPSQVNIDNVTVSSPSAKSAVAIVDNVGAVSNFIYTPDPNFSGTDIVVVTQVNPNQTYEGCKSKKSEKKECGNKNQGQNTKANHTKEKRCGNNSNKDEKRDHRSQHKITFNIIVKGIN